MQPPCCYVGLCNGTRLLFRRALSQRGNKRVLECCVLNGTHKGSTVFIPRIRLDIKDSGLQFEWTRLQFPVRLAFVLTINKSQGQGYAVAMHVIINDAIIVCAMVVSAVHIHVLLSFSTKYIRLDVTGVYLPDDVFQHGQLYVAVRLMDVSD